MTGPAERELERLGRRYAVVGRTGAMIGCGALGLLLVPDGRIGPMAACLAVLAAWSVLYGRLVLRTSARWPVALDTVVVAVVALTQGWSVPAAARADGNGWILAVVSMSVVTYQWHTPITDGGAATTLLAAAYLTGSGSSSGGHGEALPMAAIWLPAEALLSRGLYLLVRRGGRQADAGLREQERARRRSELSRARRSDEREHLSALHDTAAATLLMIGMGAVPERQPWLAEQARRDVRELHGVPVGGGFAVEIGGRLARLADEAPVIVRRRALPTVVLPPGPATAICHAVREALANVARHAGTGQAWLSMTATDPVVVEVRDGGCGFDPSQVPAQRRGLSESVEARMLRAGGRASVISTPGKGTVVRLEWPVG